MPSSTRFRSSRYAGADNSTMSSRLSSPFFPEPGFDVGNRPCRSISDRRADSRPEVARRFPIVARPAKMQFRAVRQSATARPRHKARRARRFLSIGPSCQATSNCNCHWPAGETVRQIAAPAGRCGLLKAVGLFGKTIGGNRWVVARSILCEPRNGSPPRPSTAARRRSHGSRFAGHLLRRQRTGRRPVAPGRQTPGADRDRTVLSSSCRSTGPSAKDSERPLGSLAGNFPATPDRGRRSAGPEAPAGASEKATSGIALWRTVYLKLLLSRSPDISQREGPSPIRRAPIPARLAASRARAGVQAIICIAFPGRSGRCTVVWTIFSRTNLREMPSKRRIRADSGHWPAG